MDLIIKIKIITILINNNHFGCRETVIWFTLVDHFQLCGVIVVKNIMCLNKTKSEVLTNNIKPKVFFT